MQEQLHQEFFFWESGSLRLRGKWIKHPNHTSAHVLVFLHDALGSIAQWQSFPYLLSQRLGMNALIYERMGHGESSHFLVSRNAQYLHQEALETLAQLLKDLKIENPILIGHSDGGSIALIYAAHFSAQLVISMAAHILVEDITLEGIREACTQQLFLESKLKKYHGDKTHTLFQAWVDTWLHETFANWDIQKEIQGIQCPVLAIQGEKDQYGSAKQIEGIQQALKEHQVKAFWLKDGKHMPHLEAPDILIKKIYEFVNAHLN